MTYDVNRWGPRAPERRSQSEVMRAMAIDNFGDPDALHRVEVPDPEPGDHDLVVRVKAAALNPVDTKVRRGMLGERAFPLVLGYDVAGVVEACGLGVDVFRPGDEVFASPSIGRAGSNAELVLVDARSAALKPTNLSWEEAAALPLVTLTAWESLYDRAHVKPGQTVLIHAGAGGVGHVAIQLAHAKGATVITTAGRAESIAACRALGAAHVIDYTKQDFVEAVDEITGGAGVPVVFDTVGGETFSRSLACVGLRGCLVGIVDVPADAPVDSLKYKSATLHMEFMGIGTMHGLDIEANGRALLAASSMCERGKLTPIVSQTLPMTELAAAHRLQETGRTVGKIVLTPEFG